ncbi:MAG: hypothetical protein IPO29_13020 [Anaerolineae bacterium]|nr:hypothetical protein [Anaerolineae bacterium]
MTLLALARGVGRRWWLVAIPVALALTLSLWAAGRQPPPTTVYSVTQRFLAGLPPERPEADYDFARHYNWLASEYTAQSFTSVVQGTEFAAAVAARMGQAGGAATRDQVAAAIQVNPPDSFRLVVRTQWRDAAGALALAEAGNAELAQNGNSYWPQLAGNALPPVRRLDAPVPVPISIAAPTNALEVPLRVFAAALAGLALALGVAARDPIQANDAGNLSAGLAVLAVIPRSVEFSADARHAESA